MYTHTHTHTHIYIYIYVIRRLKVKREVRKFVPRSVSLLPSIWKKKEFPEEWESITVPIYKNGDKTNCSKYKVI